MQVVIAVSPCLRLTGLYKAIELNLLSRSDVGSGPVGRFAFPVRSANTPIRRFYATFRPVGFSF